MMMTNMRWEEERKEEREKEWREDEEGGNGSEETGERRKERAQSIFPGSNMEMKYPVLKGEDEEGGEEECTKINGDDGSNEDN